ncbi:MAG: rod shape-determining protein RodA, partial [Candidatus Eremiobacteraeota bacterium]|nr:rod shape-determining protein RodA [Candidatus Eremiobacteraeota bacterium]
NFNWSLAVACVLVSALGVVCIQSADLHGGSAALGEYKKQIIYVLIGIPLMVGFSFIDYRNWKRWAPGLYLVNLALLAFILRGGHSALGAQRWIAVGSFFTFQPSEAAKLILAISIAAVLCKSTYDRVQDLWKPLLTAAIPALLILKQPDLGTSLVVGAILTSQLFFGLPKLGDFLIYVMGVVIAGAAAVGTNAILKPFQKARLLVFLNPSSDPQGAGYNLNQSKIAVGNGGLFGKGLYHGTQTQLNFVPEHSRDFIFTVLGEELGFLGGLVLLALYTVVLIGGVRAMYAARDRFGFLLASGLVAMLFFHVLINVGMTIGIMPITGIPLPFMSYGGSAILTDYAAVGILLNIAMQRDKLIFEPIDSPLLHETGRRPVVASR